MVKIEVWAPSLACAFALATAGGALSAAQQQQQQQQTQTQTQDVSSTTAGVYNAEQATRGETAYNATCASCHTLSEHTNEDFKFNWNGQTVFDLYEIIRATMPQDNPGGLSKQEYVDITAYILKLNAAPEGKEPLSTDTLALKKIKIELKPIPRRTR